MQSWKSLCFMTPLEVLRLLWGPTDTGMSKNDETSSNFLPCSLLRSSTIRSPLPCLVTLWGSALRLLISSLLFLKGDFAATFRLSCELITINLTYGDQLIKEEDPIRGGKSSAFLLHAEGDAPAPPRHGFFLMSGIGEGPFVVLKSIKKRFRVRLRGSPSYQEVQLVDTCAALQRQKCKGYPGAIIPTEALYSFYRD